MSSTSMELNLEVLREQLTIHKCPVYTVHIFDKGSDRRSYMGDIAR